MIYLDTSVVLAHLLGEDRQPPPRLWDETLVSSRLLEYETWTRINAKQLGEPYARATHTLLGRLALVELSPLVLARSLEPFPGMPAIRTLDALHLATCDYLHRHGRSIELASYDARMNSAAHSISLRVYDFDKQES